MPRWVFSQCCWNTLNPGSASIYVIAWSDEREWFICFSSVVKRTAESLNPLHLPFAGYRVFFFFFYIFNANLLQYFIAFFHFKLVKGLAIVWPKYVTYYTKYTCLLNIDCDGLLYNKGSSPITHLCTPKYCMWLYWMIGKNLTKAKNCFIVNSTELKIRSYKRII